MHQVIASPQEEKFIVVRPGARAGMQIPSALYRGLAEAVETSGPVPAWLVEQARNAWGVDLDGQQSNHAVLVRPITGTGYSRATYELNKGCNFSCEMCYLPERKFQGLPLEEKTRLLDMLRDAGVLWLQITGGEPMVDPDFRAAYEYAYGTGMLLDVLTNGSRLHRPDMLELFMAMPPHKVTVSLYGATPETFDMLTRTKGGFKRVRSGLVAAKEAGVAVDITLIVTKHNAHEVEAMRAMADEFAVSWKEFGSISPTYTGDPAPLSAQAPGYLDKAAIFQDCPAGHTFFHVDPNGFVTMCKIGRENPINLMVEGLAGLTRLPAIADAQMLRTGGCTGCALSGTCRVCRPMAKAYQTAKAPLSHYCQHGDRETTA
jgi:MoaA/NifB/PqqE/SkfB family radical SAM enzyme